VEEARVEEARVEEVQVEEAQVRDQEAQAVEVLAPEEEVPHPHQLVVQQKPAQVLHRLTAEDDSTVAEQQHLIEPEAVRL